MVICGEGHLDLALLSGLRADQLLLEAGNERTRTDGQGIILALAAVKSNAVNEALEVDHGHILILHRTILYGNRSCVVLPFLVDLFLHLIIGYGNIDLLNLHALVLTERHFRLQRNFRCENKGLSLFNLHDIYRRLGDNFEFLVLCKFPVVSDGNQCICSVLIKNTGAVHSLDHLIRNLSFSESGNAHFILILLISGPDCLIEFLCSDLDRKHCHVFLFVLNL